MTTFPEQFSAARTAQVEAQLNFLRTLTSKTFESAEKIIALNLSTSRASVEKSSQAMRQLIGAEDPSDLLAFTFTSQTRENFDSMLAYGRALFSIATSLQAGLIKPAAAVAAPVAKPVALPAPEVLAAPAPPPAPAVAPAPAPVPKAARPARKPGVAVKPATSPKPIAKSKPVAKAAEGAAAKPIALAKPSPAPFPTASTQAKQMDMLTPKVDKKK